MQQTMEVDMRSVESLDRNLATLALISGQSMDAVIKNASMRAVRSAAVATPKAKKIRKNRRHQGKRVFGSKSRARKGIPWWSMGSVDIWSKGVKKVQHFRRETTFQSARQVPRRGLAKNVWIARANAFKRQDVPNRMLANRYGKTKISRRGAFIDGVSMSNSLRYIQVIAPNSARIAVHKTDKWVEGFALKQVERRMIRQFARGTAAIRGF